MASRSAMPSSSLPQGLCGVEPVQFGSGMVEGEAPLRGGAFGIALGLPSRDLAGERLLVGDAPVQALAVEHRELQFGHIEPTAVLGRGVKLKPLEQAPCFLWRDSLIER